MGLIFWSDVLPPKIPTQCSVCRSMLQHASKPPPTGPKERCCGMLRHASTVGACLIKILYQPYAAGTMLLGMLDCQKRRVLSQKETSTHADEISPPFFRAFRPSRPALSSHYLSCSNRRRHPSIKIFRSVEKSEPHNQCSSGFPTTKPNAPGVKPLNTPEDPRVSGPNPRGWHQ